MIETKVHYIVKCDTDGCGKRGPAWGTEHACHTNAITQGWEFQDVPGSPVRIYRCPKCVKAGKTPNGWEGGNEQQ